MKHDNSAKKTDLYMDYVYRQYPNLHNLTIPIPKRVSCKIPWPEPEKNVGLNEVT